MATKTRQQLTGEITALCEQHGCPEKIVKIHAAQYVDRGWHPHPSAEFETWWKTQQGLKEGIDAKRAFNCQIYRDQFLEAKQYGITEPKTFRDVARIARPDHPTLMQGGS